ncbi:hypothetical protein [Pseudozobellia thermophila]|uniref:PH domain-containing protein n=1 Tax=Pseudozobellia thermophila TaxID=192903 RepID=A0A1M6C7K3_9FLAO|nr:hypothetical protein [Pseudozobellia thermophila]SHI56985.1 hypothetical protein SAMN04488513_101670 [Pseudozobellia thermophila]
MNKNGHGLWNFLVVLTVIVCLLAFVLHSKNWTKVDDQGLKIISGFYYQNIDFSELDSVELLERIPPMERLNGFSAFEKEKGIFREFKDSLTDKKVYVFVDNLDHSKIKLVHHDSLKLYVNLKDSLDTEQLYQTLSGKLETPPD